jgi:hypothetical protein
VEWDRNTSIATEFFYFGARQVGKRSTTPSTITPAAANLSATPSVRAGTPAVLRVGLPTNATSTISLRSASGAYTINDITVTNGVANIDVSTLPRGCTQFIVTYNGDLNNATSNLGTVSVCNGVDLSAILQLLLDD